MGHTGVVVYTPAVIHRATEALLQTELAEQIANLQNGDHLCLFYDNDPAEQMPALLPFVQDALNRGEQFVYIADDQTVEQLSDRLAQSGIDVSSEIEKGALKLWTRHEWRQSDELSSTRKALQVSRLVDEALKAGFKGIRFAVEMTWTLGPDIDAKQLEHWEATLNTLFSPGFPGRIICQYNRNRLDPIAMLAALHTHPHIILGDHVHPNLFYEAPLILDGQGGAEAPAVKVDWMISQLKRARAAEKEREQLIAQKTAMAEATLSRERIEAILEVMPAAIYVCDERGRITFFNHRAAEIWGRAPLPDDDYDKFCGSFRLWRADGTLWPHAETPMAAAVRTGARCRNQEVIIERPSGSRIAVTLNIDPLFDSKGRPCGAINVLQDVTDLKEAEAASRRLAAIVESSDDAIISTDLNGSITSWNQGAERLLGYQAHEVIGQFVSTLVPIDRNDEEPGIVYRIRQGERIDHYETVRQRKDGSLVEVSLTVSPIKNAGGQIIGVSKIARDISHRKRAEEALRKAKDELANANEDLERKVAERTAALEQEQAARLQNLEEQKKLEEQLRQSQKMESIGTLAGGIAHDFNNILNIIKGYTSDLAAESPPHDNLARSINVIDETIERGATIVRQLLTLARKSETHLALTDVNSVISDLDKLLSQTLPKTITLSLSLDRNLPPVMADPSQITQTLLNLCVNARDAMPVGGTLTIRTSSVDAAQGRKRFGQPDTPQLVCIEVIDTGTGMDAGVRARMFEPFFTTKGPGEGTGLGLAIVYATVRNHGGFIDVESAVNSGTVFRLYLPAAISAVGPAAHPAAKEEPRTQQPEGKGTILVAEDEENMLRLLRRVLTRSGYQVLLASDGEEVINIYRANKQEIDVVLLDIGLPKVAGWNVVSQLQEQNRDVKIVITSGYIDPDLKVKLDGAGVKAVLYKPYRLDQIIDALHDIVEPSEPFSHRQRAVSE
jgi:PAS domain S-box-containing protein